MEKGLQITFAPHLKLTLSVSNLVCVHGDHYNARSLIIPSVYPGLMPTMLCLVSARTHPRPQPRSQIWSTSCCKHLRHHTAAWVPVYINTRVNALSVFMGTNRTSILYYWTELILIIALSGTFWMWGLSVFLCFVSQQIAYLSFGFDGVSLIDENIII